MIESTIILDSRASDDRAIPGRGVHARPRSGDYSNRAQDLVSCFHDRFESRLIHKSFHLRFKIDPVSVLLCYFVLPIPKNSRLGLCTGVYRSHKGISIGVFPIFDEGSYLPGS
jgi:hypothetical protein